MQQEIGQNYRGCELKKKYIYMYHLRASREQQASRLHTIRYTNVVVRVAREKAKT